MKGYFDTEDPEVEEPEERGHDTELTLSMGAQLGIVFCLLLLCGLCFGLGYWVGHGRSAAAPAKAATEPAAPTAAPDQEPLQGNGTLPKPSADAQVPPTPPETGSDGTTPSATPTPEGSGNPAPAQPAPSAAPQPHAPTSSPVPEPAAPAHLPSVPAHVPTSPAHAPAAPAPSRPPAQARPAYSSGANEPNAGQTAPAMRPAFSGAEGPYMVQIAAVLHADDANVLVNALRKRGFEATAERMPSDGLVHVRIGPFATHEEASRMSTRLLEDGYNAMVQP